MFRTTLMVSTLAAMLALPAFAQDAQPAPQKDQVQQKKQMRDRIYGHQLMTPDERIEYRSKMRFLKTPEECDAFRAEHHKKMQERAKEKGITLPDELPMKGCPGMGPRRGPGAS